MNAARSLSFALLFASFAACGGSCAITDANTTIVADSAVEPPSNAATGTDACNPTNAEILGEWAWPEVYYVNAEGDLSPARGWGAELWLPESSYGEDCWFSCASKFLSAAFTAAAPATFVRLVHRTEGARRLGSSGATLSIAGAAPLAQTTMGTDRFEPYEATAYQQSSVFAFPPTNPPIWDYLEVTIPIKGSRDQLRVRFTRGHSRPGWGGGPHGS